MSVKIIDAAVSAAPLKAPARHLAMTELNCSKPPRRTEQRLKLISPPHGVHGETFQWLTTDFTCPVRYQEPLRQHTSFRVGGPSDIYIMPEKPDQLQRIIQGLAQRQIPWMVIGKGSNLLVLDGGIRGAVISLSRLAGRIEIAYTSAGEVLLSAPAGINLATLCACALAEGLDGLNRVIGIPGSVGGGIRMNAGMAQGDIASVLDSVTMMTASGKMETYQRSELEFGYRRFALRQAQGATEYSPAIILSAGFKLQPADRTVLRRQARELMRRRMATQPLGEPSAGCVFKNPGEQFPPAGKLIDMLGLKGKTVGGARISPKHANFIVTTGQAQAADILALIHLVKETVYQTHHILLETEVQIAGEQKN